MTGVEEKISFSYQLPIHMCLHVFWVLHSGLDHRNLSIIFNILQVIWQIHQPKGFNNPRDERKRTPPSV